MSGLDLIYLSRNDVSRDAYEARLVCSYPGALACARSLSVFMWLWLSYLSVVLLHEHRRLEGVVALPSTRGKVLDLDSILGLPRTPWCIVCWRSGHVGSLNREPRSGVRRFLCACRRGQLCLCAPGGGRVLCGLGRLPRTHKCWSLCSVMCGKYHGAHRYCWYHSVLSLPLLGA